MSGEHEIVFGNKPREFWLYNENDDDPYSVFIKKPDRGWSTIHVIEYSEVERLRASLDVAKAALEFYADGEGDVLDWDRAIITSSNGTEVYLDDYQSPPPNEIHKYKMIPEAQYETLKKELQLERENYTKLLEQAERIVSALKKTKGSMKYAYEDRADQYYLNVLSDIESALKSWTEFRERGVER